MVIDRHVGLPLYPTGTRPNGAPQGCFAKGTELTSFLRWWACWIFKDDFVRGWSGLLPTCPRMGVGGDGRGVSVACYNLIHAKEKKEIPYSAQEDC